MYTIQLDFPGKNALSTELLNWLLNELDVAQGQPILLTGTGDAFSAGLNLREIASLDDAGVERFIRTIDELALRLFQYPAPVVAAVNGHAIAGGCVLAMCCDHRVATDSPKAKIGLNEVALGVTFPPVVLNVCLRRLDPLRARRVMLGGELFSVREALELGLVDELADDPVAAAQERLAALGKHPRVAYAHTKALLNGGVEPTPEDLQRFETIEVPIWNSDDVKQRVRAALERK